MADTVGTPGSGDPGPFDDTWPSQPPTRPPEPASGPTATDPSTGFGSAPTAPDLPRTLEAPVPPGGAPPPFFHDVSGAASSGPFGDPYGSGSYPPPGAAPAYPPASGYPPANGYPPAPGLPAPGYPPPPYGGYGTPYGPYAYGGWAPPKNNGLAIAAMVAGIVGIAFCQLAAIPAVIMGFIARKQIRESEGTQTGDAFALTGIITGGIATVLFVLMIVLYAGMFGLAFSSGDF
jgi:hypothetical protein